MVNWPFSAITSEIHSSDLASAIAGVELPPPNDHCDTSSRFQLGRSGLIFQSRGATQLNRSHNSQAVSPLR
jgi:hypothetical protein